MSRRPFKAQASSSRAFSGGFASEVRLPAAVNLGGFGTASSPLTYLAEQPDLSGIADSNVVVNFKNIAKKDGTTKVKALEELQAYVSAQSEQQQLIEDAFLEAWTSVYPRTSIEESRRVRQLCHLLQGKLCLASGKRMAKYMSRAIGPWISGLHDGDKVVMRSARDAIQEVFPTVEKQASLNKVYQLPILDYCRDVILKENPQTLSDERTTKLDDSEAKYARVLASCLSVVTDLVTHLSADELKKQELHYEELLSSKKLWSLIAYKDASVRRNTFRLLTAAMPNFKNIITANLDIIVNALLSHSTISCQTGSSLEFSRSLVALSSAYTTVWTTSLEGNKTAVDRFREFLKRGSQGGSAHFWDTVSTLVTLIPQTSLPKELGRAKQMLESLHTGFTRKDEPRSNQSRGWVCYFVLADRLCINFSFNEQEHLMLEMGLPPVRQYIIPDPEGEKWSIPGQTALQILTGAFKTSAIMSVAEKNWTSMANRVLEAMRTSSPEQSKDFEMSQKSVAATGARWFSLQANLPYKDITKSFINLIDLATFTVLQGCIDLLNFRNGKPFGAAATIDAALRSIGYESLQRTEAGAKLNSFVQYDLPSLVLSPSGPYIVSILYQFDHHPNFKSIWTSTLQVILNSSEASSKITGLQRLLGSTSGSTDTDLALNNAELQAFIAAEWRTAMDGENGWESLLALLEASFKSLSVETKITMLTDLVACLKVTGKMSNALSGLALVAKQSRSFFKWLLNNPIASSLLQQLLFIAESIENDVVDAAVDLSPLIESILFEISSDGSPNVLLEVVTTGLYQADSNSLSVETLVELAHKILEHPKIDRHDMAQAILPTIGRWWDHLVVHLHIRPANPLAITNPLGGAVYLVEDAVNSGIDIRLSKDMSGYSPSVRMAWYTTKLIKLSDIFSELDQECRASVYRLLLLTVQLVNDNLTLVASNGLWNRHNVRVENDMLKFVAEAQSLFEIWMRGEASPQMGSPDFSPDGFLGLAQKEMFKNSSGLSPVSFHNARAYAISVSEVIELHGWRQKAVVDLESQFKVLQKNTTTLSYPSFLVAYRQPLDSAPSLTRTCNELVADLTTLELHRNHQGGLRQLIWLNTILQDRQHLVDTIAKQRMIFFIKHIVSWLHGSTADFLMKAEVCKTLTKFLNPMKEIYGSHWAEILNYLICFWGETGKDTGAMFLSTLLPPTHASLKLLALLQVLVNDDDSNDDLKDAWQESLGSLTKGLASILKLSGKSADEFNQPLRMVNDLLARLLPQMHTGEMVPLEDFYSLININSLLVQQTAFEILHKVIPSTQEHVSLNVALDKSVARLPVELLSLILEAPINESFGEADIGDGMPVHLRGYLFSWLLVFDHFHNASDKVRSDYANHLNEGDYLSALLDFTFHFLGHAHGKPVDASKLDIMKYSINVEDSAIKGLQWLSIHIYYSCLKWLPTLTKKWWIECKSRQTVVQVESWTERYISPHIISQTLISVNDWISKQDSSSDDALTIKINQRSKEITASKEIDDQLMSIKIRLPSNFPLGAAVVEGGNRVAVDEKKWRSWLLITQGVITFSNNSITDGLLAFQRNVAGALKGHTECAICYSIISAEKQLPTKKCATCKNTFHGTCLYKWFKTSNSSSCPLCRNAFNYGSS